MSEDVRKIVQMDLESIYIGNLNTVEDNLNLPSEGKYGSQLIWTTGEERFIEVNGIVHRPLHGMGNRNVDLTVEAICGNYSEKRTFTATVLQQIKENVVGKVYDVEMDAEFGEKKILPSVVIVDTMDGRCMTMAVTWDNYEPLHTEGVVVVKGKLKDNDKDAYAKIKYKKQLIRKEAPKQKGTYFPLNQVRLLEGSLYYDYQKKMVEYLLGIDDDQMLYNFRKAAGLDTLNAEPMTGWDEESCKLKGHTTGHYMSGLGLAWAVTGDERFLDKIKYMVDALCECQEAFAKSGQYHRGFLSAYSEEQFDLLEQYTRYPEIWAPYYTLDKIMSGLYDCYQYAGYEKALSILTLMGDWVYDRLARLSKETRDKMWAMYIAGEFGGMFGTMVKLYQLTGNEKHLAAARMFYNEKLFYPMEKNYDTLEDMHANQHIPQILGAMDMYHTTQDVEYWDIAKNFWEIVTNGHIYTIGGVGETEMFHGAGTTCSYLTEKAAESCASYNMLRLTAQLFEYTMSGSLMDYYDNTLRNHILTSCSHTNDGGTTYFMPLGPGQSKEYSTTENTCCHGTGMESRFRYMENIYAYDENYIYINLWINSELNGEVKLEQRSEYGSETTVVLCKSNLNKKLKIHIPSWAEQSFEILINGVELHNCVVENGYAVVEQCLESGDKIELKLPMELRVIENTSDKHFVNLAYGPYIMAILSEEKDFMQLPPIDTIEKSEVPMHFVVKGKEMIPFAEVDLQSYHVYLKR